MQTLFVVLQSILLGFFLVQDIVSLRPLNDIPAQVKYLGWTKLILGTLFTSSLLGTSLWLTLHYSGAPLPWGAKAFFVFWWSMLMIGMYMSWYKPYFRGPTPKETELYNALFANTHTILPVRNSFPGPNTFHLVILHPLMIACAALGFLRVAGVF